MTGYSFGDVVLVPFPFTDQTGNKKRPAVVVSSAPYHRERADLILMAVTSQTRAVAGIGEIPLLEWKMSGLLKPSTLKPIFFTVERLLVLKSSGSSAKQIGGLSAKPRRRFWKSAPVKVVPERESLSPRLPRSQAPLKQSAATGYSEGWLA